MTKETMTAAQIAAKRIKEMPIHPDYKPVPSLPIPLRKGVLVRKVTLKSAPLITVNGIELMQNSENNHADKTGIIYAVGPDCSEFLRVGLRCQFNHYVDTFFFHEGETYFKMDENDVYYIVESPKTAVHQGIKKPENVRHEKKLEERKDYMKEESRMDANEKDKRLDKTKGKIRKVK